MSEQTVSLRSPAQPRASAIALTDAAAGKLKDLITAESAAAESAAGEGTELALRVAVRPGGCSGFQYEMFFDSDLAGDDLVTDYAGVKVVVDPASAPHLAGATLDYKDGLMEAGFTINNPNVSRSCGCGNSFS